MRVLAGHRVAVLGAMADRPLARFLVSLGAEMGGPVDEASFVIDDLGLEATRDLGIPETAVHVSVTPFGSGGPRSHWRGGELVASATGGALRVTGEPGRPPVKEAGDAVASIQSLTRQQALQDEAVASAEKAYRFAQERYRAGLGNYLVVLSTESQVLAQRRLAVDLRARQLDTRLVLMKALGGGWTDDTAV